MVDRQAVESGEAKSFKASVLPVHTSNKLSSMDDMCIAGITW